MNDFVADCLVEILDMTSTQYDPSDDRTDTITYQDKKRGMSQVVLDFLHIQEGVTWHLQGELAQHAKYEGTKAAERLHEGGYENKWDDSQQCL
jgi:hypothetical protein